MLACRRPTEHTRTHIATDTGMRRFMLSLYIYTHAMMAGIFCGKYGPMKSANMRGHIPWILCTVCRHSSFMIWIFGSTHTNTLTNDTHARTSNTTLTEPARNQRRTLTNSARPAVLYMQNGTSFRAAFHVGGERMLEWMCWAGFSDCKQFAFGSHLWEGFVGVLLISC